jgi:hypothetical protein
MDKIWPSEDRPGASEFITLEPDEVDAICFAHIPIITKRGKKATVKFDD